MSRTASSRVLKSVRLSKYCREANPARDARMVMSNPVDTDLGRRLALIRTALESAFTPTALTLEDESHLHHGHAGARSGRGHFKLYIVAPEFTTLTPVARHRRVYTALGALMETDIHALSIEALSPDEINPR